MNYIRAVDVRARIVAKDQESGSKFFLMELECPGAPAPVVFEVNTRERFEHLMNLLRESGKACGWCDPPKEIPQ